MVREGFKKKMENSTLRGRSGSARVIFHFKFFLDAIATLDLGYERESQIFIIGILECFVRIFPNIGL